MTQYYLRFMKDEKPVGSVGPYPTHRMAEFMKTTYTSVFPEYDRIEVSEVDD